MILKLKITSNGILIYDLIINENKIKGIDIKIL